MLCHILPINLILSVIFTSGVLSLDNGLGSDLALQSRPERQLRAARRSHGLNARDLKGCLGYNHHLHYVDADTHGYQTQFAAKVGMGFKTPALLLEDIEHHLERVECSASRVQLSFNSAEMLEHAHDELSSVDRFLLITSHLGCNEDGARDVYMVSKTSFHFEKRYIILSVSRVAWKSTFHSISLNFGENRDSFELRRHGRLRSRQAAATSSQLAAASTATFPAAPTVTPTVDNVTASVNSQWLNTTILPPASVLGLITPQLPADFTLSCKNCTIQGSIDLFSGSLTMQSINNGSTADIDFINHGFVELKTTQFGAHIELESSVQLSSNMVTYKAPLPAIKFTPFRVPGIGAVGAELDPQVTVGYQLSAGLDFTYGFDMLVPDGSTIIIDVGNVTNSSQAGFDNTNVAAIPFQAQSESVTLTTTSSFSPQLLFTVAFFDNDATVAAGAYLDLPTLTAAFTAVSHVNAQCNNVTSSNTANKVLDYIFNDTLINIIPSVGLGIGLVGRAKVDIGESSHSENDAVNLYNHNFALPTACISYDPKAKTYGPPTSSSTSKSTKNGSESLRSREGGLKRVKVAAGVFLGLSAWGVLF